MNDHANPSSTLPGGDSHADADALRELKARIQHAQSALEQAESRPSQPAPQRYQAPDAQAAGAGRARSPFATMLMGAFFALLLIAVIGLAAYAAFQLGKQGGGGSEDTPGQSGVADQPQVNRERAEDKPPTLEIREASVLPGAIPAEERQHTWYRIGDEYFSVVHSIQATFDERSSSCEVLVFSEGDEVMNVRVGVGENLPLRAQIRLQRVTSKGVELRLGTQVVSVEMSSQPIQVGDGSTLIAPRAGSPTVGRADENAEIPRDPRKAPEAGESSEELGPNAADKPAETPRTDPVLQQIRAEKDVLLPRYTGLADQWGGYYLEYIKDRAWERHLRELLASAYDQAVVRDARTKAMEAYGAHVQALQDIVVVTSGAAGEATVPNLLSVYGITEGSVIVEFQDRAVRSRADFDDVLQSGGMDEEIRLVYLKDGELFLVWILRDRSEADEADAAADAAPEGED